MIKKVVDTRKSTVSELPKLIEKFHELGYTVDVISTYYNSVAGWSIKEYTVDICKWEDEGV